MSVSDILKVRSGPVEPGFYFCDSFGFEKVDFQPGLAGNKMPETIRVVLLELGKRKVFQAQSSVSATFCLLPPRAEEEVSFCPAG